MYIPVLDRVFAHVYACHSMLLCNNCYSYLLLYLFCPSLTLVQYVIKTSKYGQHHKSTQVNDIK